jgi:hypothetical protein
MNENSITVLSKIEKVDNIINIKNSTYTNFCNFSLDPNKFTLTKEEVSCKTNAAKTWVTLENVIEIYVNFHTCRLTLIILERYTYRKLSEISIECQKMNLELFSTIGKIINLLEPL